MKMVEAGVVNISTARPMKVAHLQVHSGRAEQSRSDTVERQGGEKGAEAEGLKELT